MAQPSLIVVPSRFKAGTLYAYSPLQTAPVSFGVTRGTTATRINSAGLIESVASGVPRLDYGAGACPSLLVEPAATNLVLFSEQFDDAYWGKSGGTANAGQLSPDGQTNAFAIRETAVTNIHGLEIATGFAVTSGTTYSFSIYAKNSGRFMQFVTSQAGFSTNLGVEVDLNNGVATQVFGGVTYFIEPMANGFYRISFSATAAASTTANIFIYLAPTSGGALLPSYAGDASLGVDIYGAQIEIGSVRTSYIPTTSATATRNADVISLTNASGFIGQQEGYLYAEVDVRNFANAGMFLSVSDGTLSNRLELYKFTDSKIYFDRVSATQSALSSLGSNTLTTGVYKIAVGYKSGDTVFFVNGAQIGSAQTQTFTFATMNKINIGSHRTEGEQFNDRINAIAIGTTRPTNAELAQLTTL